MWGFWGDSQKLLRDAQRALQDSTRELLRIKDACAEVSRTEKLQGELAKETKRADRLAARVELLEAKGDEKQAKRRREVPEEPAEARVEPADEVKHTDASPEAKRRRLTAPDTPQGPPSHSAPATPGLVEVKQQQQQQQQQQHHQQQLLTQISRFFTPHIDTMQKETAKKV